MLKSSVYKFSSLVATANAAIVLNATGETKGKRVLEARSELRDFQTEERDTHRTSKPAQH
jgi:hypothetical protein